MSKVKTPSWVESVLNISAEVEAEYKAYSALEDTTKSVHQNELRLTNLERYFDEAREVHQKIMAAPNDDVKVKYVESLAFHHLKELYYTYSSELKERITSSDHASGLHNSTIASKAPNVELKLPPIKIPTFSGSFDTWPEFKALFESLVNKNTAIPECHKLHYLKTNLSGEAARLLRNTSVEGNFESAWALLVKRYQNLRWLKDNQFKLLFEQRRITHESSDELKRLLDTTNEVKQSLHNLGVPVKSWEDVLIFHTVQKLPRTTRSQWESHIAAYVDYPAYSVLEDFLLMRSRTLSILDQSSSGSSQARSKGIVAGTVCSHNSRISVCSMCQGTHSIRNCQRFKALSVKRRQEVARTNKLCFNCLSNAHFTQHCGSSYTCANCHQRHHSLLHNDAIQAVAKEAASPSLAVQQKTSPPFQNIVQAAVPGSSRAVHNTHLVEDENVQTVLLATALVKAYTNTGIPIILRALIDPGSEASFISEGVVQLLHLTRDRCSVNIQGVGESKTCASKHKVSVTLCSTTNPTFELHINAFVLPKLTTLLPPRNISTTNWSHIKHLELADPTFNKAGRIDILLGSDTYSSILLDGVARGERGTPIAQKTELGWVLSGCIGSHIQKSINSLHIVTKSLGLEKILTKFWELEEVPRKKLRSAEEEQSEMHFAQTHQRLPNGRYMVRLPFKKETPPSLGSSYNCALARYLQLERRFRLSPKFHEEYKRVVEDYRELGHMSEVFGEEHTADHYYIPHHAVIKEASTTTKLRIVFDASCKTSNGTSLNDHLLIGPRLQDDIINHIARFRKHQIVFTADITKMYRQIWLSEKETRYQLILWRDKAHEAIKTYRLSTVTFGTASASYLAVRTLQQLAFDERSNYPIASQIATKNFYVDDVLHGADSEEEAIQMQRQLTTMLRSGGFHLRKWASNSEKLLALMPKEDREVQVPLSFDEGNSIKTLGIQWNPATDMFKFDCDFPETAKGTKRAILSDIARLYDPMGWISPCVVRGKLLLQEIWKQQISWDDDLPASIATLWYNLRAELNALSNIEIPRWISFKNGSQVELHGFCDASEKAYAAVVYARSHYEDKWISHLLVAKTRVAPLKKKSLARLELCGALLLAQLLTHTIETMEFQEAKVYAWCDSQITLAWIKTPPYVRTTFVANRVAEIQELTSPNQWNYVASKNNPADLASRGTSPSDLATHQHWWYGPEFMQSFDEQKFSYHPIKPTELEIRASESSRGNTKIVPPDASSSSFFSSCMHVIALHDSNDLLKRYSSLERLLRIAALCLRFCYNAQWHKGHEKRLGAFTQPELAAVRTRLIMVVQRRTLAEEYSRVSSGESVPKGSKIARLSPIMDAEGVLRVGGRLENANLPHSQRHPIILPSGDSFTQLLIQDTHNRTLHGGQQLMMATLKQQFWILNIKSQVKSCISKCLKCFRHRAKQMQERMADLPAPRVNPARPFYTSGVDYAGPVQLKAWKGRCNKITKAYIAIFVCFCTKAVHLELVSDYSTPAFIAAFKRFTARRGICHTLYSDCGTNFQGAAKYLDSEANHMSTHWHADVTSQLQRDGTTWKFNPPAAPHFGGLWEAGVKSMKHHLRRVIGRHTLTFEEYATVLAQVEACLNSRPLCPITSDPDDLSYLTPGHFLIGSALNNPPERDLSELKVNYLDRWQLMQRIQQDFWKYWKAEYLSRLQQRPKWLSTNQDLKVGQLVLLLDEQIPPTRWHLGRIEELHPGKDGRVRVVTLKTATTKLKRPITKIALLPMTNKEDELRSTSTITP